MSESTCINSSQKEQNCVATEGAHEPDCLHCMRQKLRATSIVVFFRNPDSSWHLANFQGDKPLEAAEVEFQQLLFSKLPDCVAAKGISFYLNDDQAIKDMFGADGTLLLGQAVIAGPVRKDAAVGIRLAWRDANDPYNASDLETIECNGCCPLES